MKTQHIRRIALLTFLFSTLLAAPLLAAADFPDLINRAGMQRMLSQRIAKAYFYNGMGVSKTESRHQMDIGLKQFEYNDTKLKTVEDSATREAVAGIEASFRKFKQLVSQPYSKENAAAVLELSEILLESSHGIVLMLEELSGAKIDRIINISGRQRMLSQRISLHYMAYHAGFHDDKVVQNLKNAVSEFTYALDMLKNEQSNTKHVKMLLTKTERLWSSASPFLLNVERDEGNPLLVLSTTDEIATLADKVTDLYVNIASSKK
jgi:hypothetical protein